MKLWNPAILASAVFLFGFTSSANAGVVNGGSLVSASDADQFETWLGLADQDFTNVFSGIAGVASAADFHNAVDGVGPTFSVYGIRYTDGSTERVGGFTTLDWGGPTGYQYDSGAFIFNLDSLELQSQQHYPQYAIYRNQNYFSTFGGGHDLMGGYGTLGTSNGSGLGAFNYTSSGYTNNHSYDQSQGYISSGPNYASFAVDSLEVFTFADAVDVPAPAPLMLFGLGLALMGSRRKIAP